MGLSNLWAEARRTAGSTSVCSPGENLTRKMVKPIARHLVTSIRFQNLAMYFVPNGKGPVDTDAVRAFMDMDGDDYFRRIGVKPPLRTYNQGTIQLLFSPVPSKGGGLP